MASKKKQQKQRGLVKGSVTARKAGQKAKVSRKYNQLIKEAEKAGLPRKASAYKAHKTMKIREIEFA